MEQREHAGSYTGRSADKELQLSEERTLLAANRTRDALERTLMSWIRTSLSMIAYGFGLFKVLQYMITAAKDGTHAPHPAADILAMGLVAMGTLLLIGASLQYNTASRDLQREHPTKARLPLPLVGAAGVALMGIFAFLHLLLTVIA